MTHTNQTVDSIGSGTRFTFAAAGDSYLVVTNVTVQSTDNIAVVSYEANVSLRVDGLAESLVYAAGLLNGAGSEVMIGRSGTLRSMSDGSGDPVLLSVGGQSEIVNLGKILGEAGLGVVTFGGSNSVVNHGVIQAGSGVILNLAETTDDTFENFGKVMARGLDHDSDEYGLHNGVVGGGANTLIINHKQGSISSGFSEGAGVAIVDSGHGSQVLNQGKITSGLWYGVDFFNMDAANSARLENSGQIKGVEGSFRGNEAADFVVNTGLMRGALFFHGGDDILDGGKGMVIGKVFGGDGNDILRAGKGNQSIDGGLDNDILDGGKGRDVLLGGTGLDTFVFSTGYGKDSVRDFEDGTDHIDLSGWKALKDFDDLLSHAAKKGDGIQIVAGKDVLFIDDITKGELDADSFLF